MDPLDKLPIISYTLGVDKNTQRTRENKMKNGTEKQVAYAESLKKHFIERLNFIMGDMCESAQKSLDNANAFIETLNDDAIAWINGARDLTKINTISDIREFGARMWDEWETSGESKRMYFKKILALKK